MDLIEILFVLGIIVTVVTVVGHGIWVILAATIRALFGRGRSTSPSPTRCVSCGHPSGIVNGQCTFCGHVTTTLVDRNLSTTRDQIEDLYHRGLLEEEPYQAVNRAISVERGRLHGPFPLGSSEQRAEPGAKPGVSAQELVEAGPSDIQFVESPAPAPPATPTSQPESVANNDAEVLEAEIVSAEVSEPSSPFDVPDTPPTTSVRVAAHRTLADMLQAFMEEKNIRWGELASGMLIVGSAIGLVISLRHSCGAERENPLLARAVLHDRHRVDQRSGPLYSETLELTINQPRRVDHRNATRPAQLRRGDRSIRAGARSDSHNEPSVSNRRCTRSPWLRHDHVLFQSRTASRRMVAAFGCRHRHVRWPSDH